MALAGAPVVTRDGREVTHVLHFPKDHHYPVEFYTEGRPWATTENGFFYDNKTQSGLDLLMRLPDDPDPVGDDWRFNHFEP